MISGVKGSKSPSLILEFNSQKNNSNLIQMLMIPKNAPQNSTAEVIKSKAASSNQNLFVIEREIPGAGKLSQEELKAISVKSNSVLAELGSEVGWLHSYVTGDKLFCVYTAPNEEMVREHAKKGGFPINSVNKVEKVIDPSTAE